MERLKRLIELVPEFVGAGLLDSAGGNLAVRTSKGIYVTPSQAGEQLRWRLSLDDFVLFPGTSEASMARAGRRPSRENHIHRAVLAARADFHCTYLGHPWGALGFALARRPLPLSAQHSRMINRHKEITVPVLPEMPAVIHELAELASHTLATEFREAECAALLLGGVGLLTAAAEPETLLALSQSMENCARAQAWQLR
jgi:ribulose-5-phosphate 4-epimerase/fuculose-1-phosphate aldolase